MKNTKAIILIVLVFLQNYLLAQDHNYAVSNIPLALLKNANVVVRMSEEVFTIHSMGKGKLNVKKVYTILNEKAKDLSELVLHYSKLRRVSHISAKLYDASGQLVDKLKKGNIRDYGTHDGVSFVSDSRVKYMELSHHAYPYTIEFEYEMTYDGLMFYPDWNPYSEYRSDITVEESKFKIITPKDIKIRYKELNLNTYVQYQEQQVETFDNTQPQEINNKVEISTEKDTKTYTWHLRNLGTFKDENFNIAWWSSRPFVRTGPTYFEIEGYTGIMNTWSNYGRFIYQLNLGRDSLPPQTVSKVKEMTKDLENPLEKAKVIYEYLQSKTRYVGIQLGLGGWQPFPALEVDEKGYGDCKALTNYTKAMLNEVGVTSYYTLVNAGKDTAPIDVDFPSAHFNHAFLCIPTEKDTVWLECTSQTEAFGYSGDFTGDREVLLITPEGGKIVHTTIYKQKDNLLDRQAEIFVSNTGEAKAKIQTNYSALQEGARGYFSQQSEEKQKKWLYEEVDIPSFEIERFSLERTKNRVPITKEILNLKIRKYASKTGKRLFVKPNLMNKWSFIPEENTNRTQEVHLNAKFEFMNKDNIVYHIPEEYQVEALPQEINISSRFGTYKASFEFVENKLIYTRNFEMKKGTYPAESYEELRNFYKKIAKADKARVVFVLK